MAAIPVEHTLIFTGILFALGLAGILMHRNLILILLSIEILFNAAGAAFIFAASKWGQPDGQIMFMFVLAIAASEMAVGLALALQFFHRTKTTSIFAMKQEKDELI